MLAGAIASRERKPRVFVSGSAIGYYGSRGDEVLTEDSAPGDDFLAGVVQRWEAETQPAVDAGIRTVNIRTGIVLAEHGGVLKRMLLPFKLGAGGRVGSGKQWMSWITLDDEVGAIMHAIESESLRGPVNLVAPTPVVNAEFTSTLGKVLHRPTVLPTPLLPLKLVYGAELVELAAARESARDADTPRGERLHVPTPDARSRPSRGARDADVRIWVDSDIGGNPDDAIALLCAARASRCRAGRCQHGRRRRREARRRSSRGSCRRVPVVRGLAAAGRGADAPTRCCSSGRGPTAPSSRAPGDLPKRVAAMGGALRPVFHRGELRVIEHNVSRDPAAAQALLAPAPRGREPAEPVLVVPLDVSATMICTRAEELAIVRAQPRLADMIARWRAFEGDVPLCLHDPLALLALLGEPGIEIQDYRVSVARERRDAVARRRAQHRRRGRPRSGRGARARAAPN